MENLDALLVTLVDDCPIAARDNVTVQRLKGELGRKYKLTDNGEIEHFNGIHVLKRVNHVGKHCFYLSQRAYTERILKDFNMSHCNPSRTPQDPHVKLCKQMEPKTIAEQQEMANIPYRAAIGALILRPQ